MLQLPSGLKVERAVRLAPFTSWTVGGEAEYFVQPTRLEELREAVAFALIRKLPITILGGGTNVLVADRGVPGLTLALRKFADIEARVCIDERPGASAPTKFYIECLTGTSKTELLKQFLKHRLMPALFLAGLPGDVGGGIAMNAGVSEKIAPREFVELTEWIEVLRWDSNEVLLALTQVDTNFAAAKIGNTPSKSSTVEVTEREAPGLHQVELEAITNLARSFEIKRIPAAQLNWSYRHCNGWQPGVITRVGLSWPMLPVEDLLVQVKQANHSRLLKQPLDLPSCGSVFVNPVGHTSGQLNESCGLKGFSIGGAEVSLKHANFIVNRGGATASDIHAVIEHVKSTVLALRRIVMKTEVVYMGDWS